MKSRILKISSVVLLTLLIVGVFGHVAHAQSVTGFLGFPNLTDLMTQAVSSLVNYAVMGMGFLLALAGSLLNFSINLTLHIKDFVSSTPAIYTTWKAIRDISGIFIIFALLFAALQLILGLETSKFQNLIKDVVIVGLLINFSFFFAGLGIDASNIVSVQIYNAIAPANTLNTPVATQNLFGVSSDGTGSLGFKDGGLSDIFMSSLKIQTVAQTGLTAASGNTSAAPASPLIIFFGGLVAVLIEFVAALSFVAAAAAFIFRFVILLLLLAFSPIWIAARIIPQVKTYSNEWTEQYYSMLIFMPVYLLLMYLALNVLTSNPNGLFGTVNSTGVVGTGAWYSGIFVLGVNAFLVCFLLNLPLVAAVKMGGLASSFINTNKIGMGAVSKWAGGWVGTRTVGRAASAVNSATGNTKMGNSLIGRSIRGATVGALAKNKMGYTYSNDDRVKEQKDISKKSKEIVRGQTLTRVLDEAASGTVHTTGVTPSSLISKMSEKEKLGVIGGALKENDDAKTTEILKHVRGSDFEAVKKSEDVSDEGKAKVSNLRKSALSDALTKGQKDVVKHMVDNMDGKDLLRLGDALLIKPEVIENLKPSQLRTMAEEGLSDSTKRSIGNAIETWPTPHKSKGYVQDNKIEWL